MTRQLYCARCFKSLGELHAGHIETGARLICARCDDKKMSQSIPAAIPEFMRQSPAINKQIALASREDFT